MKKILLSLIFVGICLVVNSQTVQFYKDSVTGNYWVNKMPVKPKDIRIQFNRAETQARLISAYTYEVIFSYRNIAYLINQDSVSYTNKADIILQMPELFANSEIPKESNGAIPVNILDQTTQPIDALFARSLSVFSLADTTDASGITTLNYQFVAKPGSGILNTSEILLLDTADGESFYAEVLSISNDTVTLDRPIDKEFPHTKTLGRIVSTEMAVDGSATPVIFSARAGSNPDDYVRFILTILSETAGDDGEFGDLEKLTRGLVFRIVDSFQKTIFCFKTNGEIAQFCFDANYNSKSPAGTSGFNARITFGGTSKHGVVLRISEGDVLQWVVQDDLTGLESLKVAAQGHATTD